MQNETFSVERDFFKLLNNSNLGIDLRNNVDNCALDPLYEKKMTTIFSDNTFRHFFSPVHLREEIIQTFQGKVFALN